MKAHAQFKIIFSFQSIPFSPKKKTVVFEISLLVILKYRITIVVFSIDIDLKMFVQMLWTTHIFHYTSVYFFVI